MKASVRIPSRDWQRGMCAQDPEVLAGKEEREYRVRGTGTGLDAVMTQ